MTTTEPEELDDDTIDVDDDDTPEPEEEYVPPTKAELAEIKAALKKANDQAKHYRLAARSGQPAMGPGSDAEGIAAETDKAITKAKAEAVEEAEKTWKPRLVKAHALAAFAAAGCKTPERAARLLDLDSITFDDDGNPEGLDDQVEELKTDMPELFDKPRGRGAPRGVDAGSRAPAPGKKLSATERQLQAAGLL
jgi:hypothetical protein